MMNLMNFFAGFGEAIIEADQINISNYPFEPASIYPNSTIGVASVGSISLSWKLRIKLKNELIFVDRKHENSLAVFASANNISIDDSVSPWSLLLEPFLDTEYTAEIEERTDMMLGSFGLSKKEVADIRNEVSEQMYKYNFDTMLWEWCYLGLHDVLCAMRMKYNKEQFRKFYRNAMDIELRPRIIK